MGDIHVDRPVKLVSTDRVDRRVVISSGEGDHVHGCNGIAGSREQKLAIVC